ncbi:MAG: hypothetical protein CM15mP32_4630 [Flavobacteriaceae bacterium]|nr:MAG: hypothetical protein CM15mP32_4630 [Flavobacteriaceae bacterium]
MPEFSKIEIANENYNPTLIDGLTNVVHEIYTIYPSGKVERKIMDGRKQNMMIGKMENPLIISKLV